MKKPSISKLVNFFIALAQSTGGEVDHSRPTTEEMSRLARKTGAEGIVLLKNDGALPLKDNDVLSVFGRVQNDYFYVGYGSGGDVKPPYKVSLMEGIKNAGITINEKLAGIYSDWCKKNPPDEGFWGHWPLCFPEMPIADDVVEEASKSSTVAAVVIGRAAGEDREQKLVKGGYLLTDDERALLGKVTNHFDKVVVLLDAGNIMDMSWVEEYGDKLSAVLYLWQGGMESGNAVADVLRGKVNPSGHLTDTIARNYADYPSSKDFGKRKFNNYREDVYVGYRYFSTFDEGAVIYPFGYGLSYTTFDTKGEFTFDGKNARLNVTVKNTGDREGKEVAQVYVEAPQGKLGKPLRSLVAFAKTDDIPAGEESTLALTFNLDDVVSYDDKGHTGYKSCYIAEVGEYKVYLGDNVRDAVQVGTFTLDTPYVVSAEECCPVRAEAEFDVLYPVVKDGKIEKAYRKV
ncbi:MAG: glycoside hydrolase family 3 C-terminal domain-containing protein, partial [Clostridia bacterium]|nr:glycoside hydrolase family 3 C-terminal domain-containing protein [Clostridia bacterium]